MPHLSLNVLSGEEHDLLAGRRHFSFFGSQGHALYFFIQSTCKYTTREDGSAWNRAVHAFLQNDEIHAPVQLRGNPCCRSVVHHTRCHPAKELHDAPYLDVRRYKPWPW